MWEKRKPASALLCATLPVSTRGNVKLSLPSEVQGLCLKSHSPLKSAHTTRAEVTPSECTPCHLTSGWSLCAVINFSVPSWIFICEQITWLLQWRVRTCSPYFCFQNMLAVFSFQYSTNKSHNMLHYRQGPPSPPQKNNFHRYFSQCPPASRKCFQLNPCSGCRINSPIKEWWWEMGSV